MVLLKVKNLCKKFTDKKTVRVLKSISFEVKTGQHLFIIGETGSGKSTLLKSIFGLVTPEKGKVLFKKKILSFQNQLVPGFKEMKLVEQDFNLKKFNTLRASVESKLELGLSNKEKLEKTNKLLDLFQLRKLASKQILELSGGQQQRVALAQAFANLPELLLLDEPFAHLDPQLKTNIFRHIQKSIENQGLTVITVTHDYVETLKHADVVIALEKGKIVQQGSVSDLYYTPVNCYVAGLLGTYSLLKICGAEYLLRPEDVNVSDKGKFKGEIAAVLFCGSYFELEIEMDNQRITGFYSSDTKLIAGQIVRLNLNLKLEIINNVVITEK